MEIFQFYKKGIQLKTTEKFNDKLYSYLKYYFMNSNITQMFGSFSKKKNYLTYFMVSKVEYHRVEIAFNFLGL